MDILEDRYLRNSRFLLLLIGQWPFDKSNVKYLKRGIVCTVMTIYIIILVTNIITTKYKWKTLTEVLPFLMDAIIILTKYFTYWIHNSSIQQFFITIRHNWQTLKCSKERNTMIKYSEEAWFYTAVYICNSVCTQTGSTSLSVMLFMVALYSPSIMNVVQSLNKSREQQYNFDFEFYIDREKYFFVIHLYLQSVILLITCILLASDITYIIFTFQCCGMLRIAGYRFQHIFDDIQEMDGSNKNSVLRQRMASAVDYHSGIIEYVEATASCYTTSHFIQFLLIVLEISGLLYNIRSNLLTSNNSVLVIGLFINLLIHYFILFLNIFSAERGYSCSSDLFQTVCKCQWYRAPLKIQKLMWFVMTRTGQPFIFSFHGIFNVTFELFVKIVQLSFSYFMILCSVQK